MNIDETTPPDRRHLERIVLDAPWFADATIGKKSCGVSIIDFSNAGAKLQTIHDDSPGSYRTGDVCEFIIHMPSGKKMRVKASLSWSFRLPEGALIGVRFTDTPDEMIFREMTECRSTAGMAN